MMLTKDSLTDMKKNTTSIFFVNYFHQAIFVGSTEAPSKVFLLFFLLPDWLELNHHKSRMECGFSDIFSPYLFDRRRNNRRYKQLRKIWREKCSENHI